ncbi:uncharacterized protein LOC118439393 [Folsomia candida]|uniref:Speckle-type POZ protein B n=1 Tax=Folsomia candida TaxID=158441 RepID=A0A226D4T1_FOLCA|nr:uncharacterized protein LOC118439393 [Folsomia candida]OXA40193.1 Speckle-type POZ protein B [Folsomia candida]
MDKMETSELQIKDELYEEFSWNFKIPKRSRIQDNISRVTNSGFIFPNLKFSRGFLSTMDHTLSVGIYPDQINASLYLPFQPNKFLELRTCRLELFSSTSPTPLRPVYSTRLSYTVDPVPIGDKLFHRYAAVWNSESPWDDAVDALRLKHGIVYHERGEVTPYANADLPMKLQLRVDGDDANFGGFDNMFLSRKESDVMFICDENVELPAHRFLLCSKSTVFKRMFAHDMKEAKGGKIIVDDISAPVLKEFLRFLYCREVNSTEDDHLLMEELFKVAEKYDVPKLKYICEKSLVENVGVENATEMYCLGDIYNGDVLKEQALRVMIRNKDRIFPDAATMKEFLDLYPGVVFKLLQN